MSMKTVHKIALAKAAYRALHAVRKIAGLADETIVFRRGIRYALDLSQGIDLAIYLQGQFERLPPGPMRATSLPATSFST